MKILNLETENFRAEFNNAVGRYMVTARSPMGKALFRYKKLGRVLGIQAHELDSLAEQLTGLEASVAKLAAI